MPLTSSPLPLTPPSPPRGGDDGRGEIRRIKVARFFLSIGSNLGERRQNLQAAIQRLRAAERIRVLEVSRLYETEPWERAPGQIGNRAGWILNCVVAVETGLAPAGRASRRPRGSGGPGAGCAGAPRRRPAGTSPAPWTSTSCCTGKRSS